MNMFTRKVISRVNLNSTTGRTVCQQQMSGLLKINLLINVAIMACFLPSEHCLAGYAAVHCKQERLIVYVIKFTAEHLHVTQYLSLLDSNHMDHRNLDTI